MDTSDQSYAARLQAEADDGGVRVCRDSVVWLHADCACAGTGYVHDCPRCGKPAPGPDALRLCGECEEQEEASHDG